MVANFAWKRLKSVFLSFYNYDLANILKIETSLDDNASWYIRNRSFSSIDAFIEFTSTVHTDM